MKVMQCATTNADTPLTTGGHYGELQVMRSYAGWYIGTSWIDDDGMASPGSRESGYFCTRDEAAAALEAGEW